MGTQHRREIMAWVKLAVLLLYSLGVKSQEYHTSYTLNDPEGRINFISSTEIMSNEWIITVDEGRVIQLAFDYLNIGCYTSEITERCDCSKLAVYEGTKTLYQSCATNSYPLLMTTSSNVVTITFTGKQGGRENYRYFSAVYKSLHSQDVNTDCGESISDVEGNISSRNYPDSYDNSSICEWTIRASNDLRIQLEILEVDIESSPHCIYDSLQIFDGASAAASRLRLDCGRKGVADKMQLVAKGSVLFIKLITNWNVTGKGFLAKWRTGSTIVHLNETEGRFNFTKSGEVLSNEWHIKVREGYAVQMTFEYLNIYCYMYGVSYCDSSKLEVYDGLGSNITRRLYQECSTNTYVGIMTSSSNTMLISFSGKCIKNNNLYFNAFYKSVLASNVNRSCGGHFSGSEGIIKSPNFPNNYPNLMVCEWIISGLHNHQINLEIPELDVELTSNCVYDSLEVYNGVTTSGSRLLHLCGQISPTTYMHEQASGGSVFIRFVTSWNVTAKGFEMKWRAGSTYIHFTKPESSVFYPNFCINRECIWNITVEARSKVQLIISTYDMPCYNLYPFSPCSCSSLDIYDGSNISTANRALSLCFNHAYLPGLMTSSTNNVVIVLKNYQSTLSGSMRMYYTSVNASNVCNSFSYNQSETLQSPLYPAQYPNNTQCAYNIYQRSPGFRLFFSFENMHLQDPDDNGVCSNDFLQIKSNKFCGNTLPAQEITTGPATTAVQFVSDDSVSSSGFRLTYRAQMFECGDSLITGSTGNISSPGYPHQYPNVINCTWTILVDSEHVVNLVFDFMRIGTSYSLSHGENCLLNNYAYIQVFDGNTTDKETLVGTYCGKEVPVPIISTNNYLTVFFKSFYNHDSGTGFLASYNAVEKSSVIRRCEGDVTGHTGQIWSPGYPQGYSNYTVCIWTITGNPGYGIRMRFIDFNVETSPSCRNNSLEIRSGLNGDSPRLARLCGSTIPRDITSSPNTWHVKFYNDRSSQSKFRATWISVCEQVYGGSSGTITSPSYPDNYPRSIKCLYVIDQIEATTIRLTFSSFQLGNDSCDSFVEVRDGGFEGSPLLGPRYCGNNNPGILISTESRLLILFYSNGSPSNKGFSATFSRIDACGPTTFKEKQGIITSPFYPQNYPKNFKCSWSITTDDEHKIELHFIDFLLEGPSVFCPYDTLKISDDRNTTICGNRYPNKIQSVGNSLQIDFKSDASRVYPGFRATYTIYNKSAENKYRQHDLFPFGGEGDSVLEEKDSAVSEVKISVGFPFTDTTQTVVYIMNKGCVAFQKNDSGLSLNLKEERMMICPYHADIRASNKKHNSGVYYRLHTEDRSVLDKATAEVKEFANLTAYSAKLVLLITWHRIAHSKNSDPETQHATVQMALISNGTLSFALVYYLKGGMKWPYLQHESLVIGISYGNHKTPLYSMLSNTSDAFTKIDTIKGNTGHYGMWILEIGNSPNHDHLCNDWFNRNKAENKSRQLNFQRLPECPCNKHHLRANWIWSHYTKHKGTITECFRMSFGASRLFEPHGKECCYSWDRRGPDKFGLYEMEYPYAGSATAFNADMNITAYLREDREAHDVCCLRTTNKYATELCKTFYDLRPVDVCNPRDPFGNSFTFGDPHIITLDGRDYTFNGWGEYTMCTLTSSGLNFVLQGRTGLAETENGRLTNATVFQAFGAEENGVRVFVELDPSTNTSIILFANNTDYTRQFQEMGDNFLVDKEYFLLKRTNSTLVVWFKSGIEMTFSVSFKSLAFSISIPNTYKSHTRGLLGNFNGLKDDDFVLPNGTILNPNIIDQQIFHDYGVKWAVTETNSVMRYRDKVSPSSYIHPEFKPIFLDQQPPARIQAAEQICGSSLACIYDYIATGSVSFAKATRDLAESATKKVKISGNTVPQLLFNSEFIINSGENATFNLQGYDPDPGDTLTYYVAGSSENIVYFNSRTGDVTLRMGVSYPFSPSFYVVDSLNMSSPVRTPKFIICPQCNNNGTCDVNDTVTSEISPHVRIAVCRCLPAWTGPSCDNDFDGCEENPCRAEQECTDLTPEEQGESSTGYTCSDCRQGYVLEVMETQSSTCTDVDECLSPLANNCSMNCENVPGSYVCSCSFGFRLNDDGMSCDDINECADHTDFCQQTCINTEGSFKCACNQGTCEPDSIPNEACVKMGCVQGCSLKTTENGTSVPFCFCFAGYVQDPDSIKSCVDEDECVDDVCSQYCRNTEGSFACSCFSGYMLSSDQRTCVLCEKLQYGPECRLTCECNGRASECHPVKGCICQDGWTGNHCETDIDECAVNPRACAIGQICSNTEGSFKCSCSFGYVMNASGICEDVDECSSNSMIASCDKQEMCVNVPGSYYCACKSGYKKTNEVCTDIDECANNGGSCQQQCMNVQGSFNCDCYFGYRLNTDRRTCRQVADVCFVYDGPHCKQICTLNDTDHVVCMCNYGYQLATDQQACIDVDECTADTDGCSHNCTNTDGGFQCFCPIGMKLDNDNKTCIGCPSGTYGENCMHSCSCGLGAKECDVRTGCVCETGWLGSKCDRDVNECDTTIVQEECRNKSANCVNFQGTYRCLCPQGYRMNDRGVCQDFDECTNNPCQQICENSEGSYRCLCHKGFSLNATTDLCVDINECSPPGIHACSQRCHNMAGSYRCSCNVKGYVLDNDGVTCTAMSTCNRTDCPTENGGCSHDQCFCNSGYIFNTTYNTCDLIDVDWCATGACEQTCYESDDGKSFNCSCGEGYLLNSDKRTCRACPAGFFGPGCNSTCTCNTMNTVSCSPVNGTCICKGGWTGVSCSEDIDECVVLFSDACTAHAECININGSHLCVCEAGYLKMLPNDTCQECPQGYYGESCAHLCNCTVNTKSCDKVQGSCTCMSGWEGTLCEHDINECTIGPNNCNGNLVSCINTDGSYHCECEVGYFFSNAGVCTKCVSTHYGKNCSLFCNCGPNAESCDGVTGTCICKNGWVGPRCQRDINECEQADPLCTESHQVCINTAGSYECGCEHGYTFNKDQICVELKQVALRVTVNISVPASDLVNSNSERYVQWNNKASEALLSTLKSNVTGLKEVIVTELRVGSLVIDAVAYLDDQNEPTVVSWFSVKLMYLELSSMSIGDQTGLVTMVVVNISGIEFRVSNHSLCEVLTFISSCKRGQQCQINGGLPLCCDSDSAENNLTIIILIAVVAIVAISAVAIIVTFSLSKRNVVGVTVLNPPHDHRWALPPYTANDPSFKMGYENHKQF